MGKKCAVSELTGLVLSTVVVGKEEISFVTKCGRKFRLFHDQDCCESVTVEDVVGDVIDLLGEPLVLAEESTNSGERNSYETFTWTFYRFATRKGHVDIRWYGTSNGYYSEKVSLEEVTG